MSYFPLISANLFLRESLCTFQGSFVGIVIGSCIFAGLKDVKKAQSLERKALGLLLA